MEGARNRSAELVPGLEVVSSVIEAVTDADAIGLITEWPEFIGLDWSIVRAAVRNPVVVDGRGALAPEPMAALGFDYSAFGRGVRAGSTEEIEAERVGTGPAVQESGVAAIDAYSPLSVD
jgi:hypothetical protein